MYQEFDKENLVVMQKAIEAALEPLGKRFGMSFKMDGRMSYTKHTFEGKLHCAIGGIEVKEKTDFELYCGKFGFAKDLYGKIFEHRGVTYKFIGFKPKAKKYPCICTVISDNDSENGNRIVFTASTIKTAFNLN